MEAANRHVLASQRRILSGREHLRRSLFRLSPKQVDALHDKHGRLIDVVPDADDQ